MDELTEVSISQMFEDSIPNDSSVITIKLDLPSDYDVSGCKYIPQMIDSVLFLQYLYKDLEIHASSAGIHLNGKKSRPHIHYHLITSRFNPTSNNSVYKKRWLAMDDSNNLDGVSFKYERLNVNEPKYGPLSYPLKEGLEVYGYPKSYTLNGQKMTRPVINFLKGVGNAIYEKHCGLVLRQEKCAERQQLALTDLFKLCNENRSHFDSFISMRKWLDHAYIKKLELTEKPDPLKFKVNCQKVACQLDLFNYSDL